MGGGSDVGQGEVSCQSNLGGGWIHCGDRGRGDVVQHGLDVGEPMMLADNWREGSHCAGGWRRGWRHMSFFPGSNTGLS